MFTLDHLSELLRQIDAVPEENFTVKLEGAGKFEIRTDRVESMQYCDIKGFSIPVSTLRILHKKIQGLDKICASCLIFAGYTFIISENYEIIFISKAW